MNDPIHLPDILDQLSNGAYPLLGTGSGRKVYDLRNGSVLKAAKNAKGYAQNQVEYIISEMDDSTLKSILIVGKAKETIDVSIADINIININAITMPSVFIFITNLLTYDIYF